MRFSYARNTCHYQKLFRIKQYVSLFDRVLLIFQIIVSNVQLDRPNILYRFCSNKMHQNHPRCFTHNHTCIKQYYTRISNEKLGFTFSYICSSQIEKSHQQIFEWNSRERCMFYVLQMAYTCSLFIDQIRDSQLKLTLFIPLIKE